MSKKGSVFQKGGGGTNFEQSVQCAFLTTLMIGGNAPSIPNNQLKEVAFQTTNRGYETDDLLALAKSELGEHRLLAQIKYNLTFSENNAIFNEVLEAFWKDFNNTELFDKNNDRLLIIKCGLNNVERNQIKTLLNWAKTHNSEVDFVTEVNRVIVKKEKLNIFRESLKIANDNKDVSDLALWEFLKCLDVLEYDFTNESSIDETYFLNLIKLSKQKLETATDKEIWDRILSYVSKLNKDGGSVSANSVRKSDIFKYFDPKYIFPYFKAIEKLKRDSEVILKPLKNTIGNFHLLRKSINESIVESINKYQITIVTGKPGVGKSAAIKDLLLDEYFSGSVFVFKADQFNVPHLANVFSNQGINEEIKDIFSCISLIPEKIIIIDSLEKLLEGDPENAFKQLLGFVKEFPDIKIVASARKYSIDLIYQKYGIKHDSLGTVEIPTFDGTEISIVSARFPQLKKLLKNRKIKTLLEIPKYLDFAISILDRSDEDLSNITLKDFKVKLWNTLVKDTTKRLRGLPLKREYAFSNIAVNRAKQMKLFVKPENSDEEAIDLLEDNNIIIQNDSAGEYSPSHDILEDWALVKYVSSIYEKYPTPKDFFSNLGNEPAIRRAFRLWVEDAIIDNSTPINGLIRATISDVSIEQYWADELLIAVFKSEDCSTFFNSFKEELLIEDASFLNRSIHLIRTACKERNFENNNLLILIPIGSGWKEIITFIKCHIFKLDKINLSIINLLLDWEYGLLFSFSTDNEEKIDVKEIIMIYMSFIESNENYLNDKNLNEKTGQLISLLYNLASVSQKEILNLIDRAFKAKNDRSNWKLHSFYEKVISLCLSGLNTYKLVEELPNLVVDVAWREWKLEVRKQKSIEDFEFGILGDDTLRDDECWGIKDKHSFSPAGIFKTPFYNLLRAHPLKGLEFITSFINYAVEFYIKSKCEYKHEMNQIKIELNDGSVVHQWACYELWDAYRGHSVTHYAIESLLMSLEKYLLLMAELKTEVSKKNIQYIFNFLLKKSNNVAISGVLTSVLIAYPNEIGKEMLPLLGVEEFYEWDIRRSSQEHISMAPMDTQIPFAQKERFDFNQLPHREKFRRGLSDFILHYQFNNRTLNPQISKIFDTFLKRLKSDDIIWKKILTEIDARNHKLSEFDEEIGGFYLAPEYDLDVTEYINSGKGDIQSINSSLEYSSILSKAYENKEVISIKKWNEIYSHYTNEGELNLLYDHPVTLAVIGLRDFDNDLDKESEEWCIKIIIDSIGVILNDAIHHNYGLNLNINILEKEIALSSFHIIQKKISTEEDKNELKTIMIYFLIVSLPDHERKKYIEYIRNIFFKEYPDIGNDIWFSLIKYAKYRKENLNLFFRHNEKELKTAKEKEHEFIKNISPFQDDTLEFSEINFEKYDSNVLVNALVILPYYYKKPIHFEYVKHLIPLISQNLKENQLERHNPDYQSKSIHYSNVSNCELFLALVLIDIDYKITSEILEILLSPILSTPNSNRNGRDELVSFIGTTLDYVVLKIYDNENMSPKPLNYNEQIDNFWKLWRHFYDLINSSSQKPFIDKLLLNIRYLLFDFNGNPNAIDQNVLSKNIDLYKEIVSNLGEGHVNSIINVFSTIGGDVFLPIGISWLVEICKKSQDDKIELVSPAATRMIKKIFYDNISEVKNNKRLIGDYIWLLDAMVELGSSEAYFFRENVITYKYLK